MLLKKDIDSDSILFSRQSVLRVARLVFNYPNKVFHIRQLENETGFSTTAVTKAVEDLQKFKIINVEETALTKNVKANLDSEEYRFYKLVFNLYRLKRYLFVNKLMELFGKPEAIVLFGSSARGEDVEESDIDILVLSSKPLSGERKSDLNETLGVYGRDFNRKINIIVLQSLDKSLPEFKNAIANGIVLYGYLKVV